MISFLSARGLSALDGCVHDTGHLAAFRAIPKIGRFDYFAVAGATHGRRIEKIIAERRELRAMTSA